MLKSEHVLLLLSMVNNHGKCNCELATTDWCYISPAKPHQADLP